MIAGALEGLYYGYENIPKDSYQIARIDYIKSYMIIYITLFREKTYNKIFELKIRDSNNNI